METSMILKEQLVMVKDIFSSRSDPQYIYTFSLSFDRILHLHIEITYSFSVVRKNRTVFKQ